MLFRRIQKITTPSYFARRFLCNSANPQIDHLKKYQFTNTLFWDSRGLVKPSSALKQTKDGRKIRKKEIKDLVKQGPFGIFDHILQSRDASLGQEKGDMDTVKTCIRWFWNNPELHVTGNVHQYEFRETPGFFTKVDIWKGERIQILIHIFEKNQPQDGVIHNHNHGFYFQNISLRNDDMYKTSQYQFDPIGEEDIFKWSREPSSGKLAAIESQKGRLLKTYEHEYKNGTTGFTEQNTLHHVSEAKGQVMSFIIREANYHGNQEILSRDSKLPEDQDFDVKEPPLETKKQLMRLIRKMRKRYLSLQ